MNSYVTNFKSSVKNYTAEFVRHPIQQAGSAIAYLVTNYWDAFGAVAAGFAFNDYGNATLGDNRWPVCFGGAAMAAAPNLRRDDIGSSRFYRNTAAGVASLAAFWTRGVEAPQNVQLNTYALAILMATGAIFLDRERIRRIQAKKKEPLEKIVSEIL
ncbi:MAG: hypothetical protein V1743_05615 [Nanoarchaeota archaeon]